MIFHLLVCLLAIYLRVVSTQQVVWSLFTLDWEKKKIYQTRAGKGLRFKKNRLYIYASIQCCSVHEVEKFWTNVFNISEGSDSTWYEGKEPISDFLKTSSSWFDRSKASLDKVMWKILCAHQNLFLRLIKQQGFRKKGISFCVLGKMHIDPQQATWRRSELTLLLHVLRAGFKWLQHTDCQISSPLCDSYLQAETTQTVRLSPDSPHLH